MARGRSVPLVAHLQLLDRQLGMPRGVRAGKQSPTLAPEPRPGPAARHSPRRAHCPDTWVSPLAGGFLLTSRPSLAGMGTQSEGGNLKPIREPVLDSASTRQPLKEALSKYANNLVVPLPIRRGEAAGRLPTLDCQRRAEAPPGGRSETTRSPRAPWWKPASVPLNPSLYLPAAVDKKGNHVCDQDFWRRSIRAEFWKAYE